MGLPTDSVLLTARKTSLPRSWKENGHYTCPSRLSVRPDRTTPISM